MATTETITPEYILRLITHLIILFSRLYFSWCNGFKIPFVFVILCEGTQEGFLKVISPRIQSHYCSIIACKGAILNCSLNELPLQITFPTSQTQLINSDVKHHVQDLQRQLSLRRPSLRDRYSRNHLRDILQLQSMFQE